MHAAADRPEFTPPPPPGLVPAVVLAVAAHLLLMLALAWGINWKRDAENAVAEAELWSALPQQAAPKPVEAPKPPPATPARPAPPPEAAALPSNADIGLAREKKAKAEAQARQEALEREKKLAQQKLEQQKIELQKQEALKKQQEKQQEAQKQKKLDLAKKAEEEKKKQQLTAAKSQQTAQQQEEAKTAAKMRQEQMNRIAGLAGATGAPDATGTAQKSSGPPPSASYANRLSAIFKSKIFYPNAAAIEGNPKVTVEVLVGPSGMILNARVTKSSGVPGWDEAAKVAVEKTGRVPPDENGKFVSSFPVNFGPKDN